MSVVIVTVVMVWAVGSSWPRSLVLMKSRISLPRPAGFVQGKMCCVAPTHPVLSQGLQSVASVWPQASGSLV